MIPLLLVLDLDETLIFATERLLPRDPDFETESYSVYERPHLRPFIHWALARYRTAVWTTASAEYADKVVAELFPDPAKLEFVWSRRRCTQRYDAELRTHYWIKDLKKLRRRGVELERCIVVDDTPQKHERNYGNLVAIAPYDGDPEDRELLCLQSYLETIDAHPNVRSLEKRAWRAAMGLPRAEGRQW